MKRLLVMLLVLGMVFGSLSVSAEGNPPQGMPEGMTPPGGGDFGGSDGSQMPEGMTPPDGGDFGGSDGSQMPEGGDFGNSDGSQMPGGGDFGNSDGSGGMPQGFPGGQGQAEGQLGSFSMGGTNADSPEGDDYAYDAALYVTAEGVNDGKSALERITEGSFGNGNADGIVIRDNESGHNGVLVTEAEYTIRGADLELMTGADGTDTCDFSGKGAAVAAFGSGTKVTVENSSIHTAGVATMPLFADSGATLTVKNSTLRSDGGTLYREYLNTPSQALMVAPPWILGIMGTSRCLNIMGDGTTVNVTDSDASAGAWAVLSTDNGSNMALNVINSTATLLNADESAASPLQVEGGQITETLDNPYTVLYGSGYGLFMIGGTKEVIAGSTVNAGTYIAILAGGSGTYTALEAGKTYELKNSAGETTAEYTADADRVTELHSDTFGFMSHQGNNLLTLEKGTKLETGFNSFLVKTGYSSGQSTTAAVDSAEIVNGGVLIQVMDNDDTTNGGMMSADDPANTNGGMQNFKTVHSEREGFRTEAAEADASVQTFTFTNGKYSGNIYNASGSDGLKGSTLNVTFGTGAEYSGAIASTAAVHVTPEGAYERKAAGGFALENAEEAAAFTEKYQNTEFTINEYYSIGQVANYVNSNGSNLVNVALKDGAVWNVAGTSLIASLTVEGDSRVVIPEGITLTIGNRTFTDQELKAGDL